jgi:hypothetical protein
MPPKAPTIAHLKGHGLDGLFVTCANAACRHSIARFQLKRAESATHTAVLR